MQRRTPVVTVGLVPGLLKPRTRNISILARTLQIDGRALAKTVARFPAQDFLPVITLRRTAYERVRPIIHPLKGVHFQTGVLPLGPTPTFGRAVLGQVGAATATAIRSAGPLALPSDNIGLNGLQLVYQRRLAGTPSGRVELVDSTGRVLSKLFSINGHPGSPVHTTLSLRLQQAAESALPKTSRPAALVAIQASTGQILAVANRPADSTYDVGLDGGYPPGSTFKVVTTAALLARGFDPSSQVACPPSITVDGKRFTNYAGESVAGATFLEDFAKSCNDAFISLAPRLRPGDIGAEARHFGFGSRWTLPLASYSGQAPPPRNAIERAADMIGQGNILASPLNMALVAAAVDSGTWRPPVILLQPRPAQRTSPHVIDPTTVSELHRLMRAVVTSGTGTAADLPGAPVFGKTGTAEFGSGNPPPTDAWFIGFRGDIAFAVVVQGGGVGGLVAAPIAARFLRAAVASDVQAR
jgi:cell division protein FtsI/penicillin-binding protein 2